MSQKQPFVDQLRRRLYFALALNAIIIVAEFTGGAMIKSVGLMSDALHNLIDQGSLFLTLYAYLLSFRPATGRSTFGYHRAGIISAMLNSVLLLVAAAGLAWMASRRLLSPVAVPGGWVIGIALVSFAANMGIALLLQEGAKGDLNIRSAFWHMLGDAWVSLGVAGSGLVILFTGWSVLDPLVSFVIVAVILKGAWPVLKESLEVLMESVPRGIDTTRVKDMIQATPGAENVHDLHLWSVKPGLTMLTCHVLVKDDQSVLATDLLRTIRQRVAREFGIRHMTIQLETECCHPEAVHCDLERLSAAHTQVAENLTP